MSWAQRYRHSPLEVHGDREGDNRVCLLCGALGKEHTLAAEKLVAPEYEAWLGKRAVSRPYLMCPKDALPEHGGPRPLAMTDRIDPALTAEEWNSEDGPTYHRPDCIISQADAESGGVVVSVGSERAWIAPADLPAAIALANAARRDDDRGKITRARLAAFRAVLEEYEFAGEDGMRADEWQTAVTARELLDALESLLPPE